MIIYLAHSRRRPMRCTPALHNIAAFRPVYVRAASLRACTGWVDVACGASRSSETRRGPTGWGSMTQVPNHLRQSTLPAFKPSPWQESGSAPPWRENVARRRPLA